MTGFSSIPIAEEGGHDDSHLAGVSKILGPRWAQLPAVTIGLLGVQVFWSVEMSYGMYLNATRSSMSREGLTYLQVHRTYCHWVLPKLQWPWSFLRAPSQD